MSALHSSSTELNPSIVAASCTAALYTPDGTLFAKYVRPGHAEPPPRPPRHLELDVPYIDGERVLLLDDLIATGGTATAAGQLLGSAGAEVVSAVFVIDLPLLGGAARLRANGIAVQALLTF